MTPLDNDPASGMNAAIAAELRAERSAQQITFDDLAQRTEISKQTLLRIFNGKRAVTMAYLEAICVEFNVAMSDIMQRAERRLGRGGVGLSPAPAASDKHRDLSDLDVILAASDRNIDAEVEAWEEQP
ncbi:helix-turn-helix transcriptional regulator [Actinomycetaceae bacterium WB03_NA08]|uniref:Helix-turn-helix transcriptional regulator n=1 Tax=Scrofimicrobium canadense TaxID=2652290 RepID=A0A6N7VTA1_9ACTO|nr:helix-turn-helix transcriptional regulator [Scrofimicrobium canadense]MSS85004.1 helix-turn-helix transcriptional regulator [Scrofimicrobium canadense]